MKNETTKIEDAVFEEIDSKNQNKVDETVKSEIRKFNLADSSIAELKKRFKGLRIKDRDDKKNIEAVSAGYKEVVKVRTALEKKRKEIKEPFIKIGKDIDAEAKRLTALIMEVETPLEAEYGKVKKWETEDAERKEQERQELIKKRVSELTESGLVFTGEFYAINEISMDIVTIEKMSEADYDFLVAKVKIEKKKNDDVEAKRLAEEAAEKQRQAEIAEQNRKDREAIIAEKLEMRTEKLEAVGFVSDAEKRRFIYSGEGGFYELLFEEAADMPLEIFKTYLNTTEHEIAQKKANTEAQRLEKQKADENAKEKLEAERLERLPDLDKIERYADELLAVKLPQLKNKEAAEVLAEFKNGLKTLVDGTIKKVKKLQ